MDRIIINYSENTPTLNALHYVNTVVQMGRMSGLHEESYCYCTKFIDGTVVLAEVTKAGSDKFTILDNEEV